MFRGRTPESKSRDPVANFSAAARGGGLHAGAAGPGRPASALPGAFRHARRVCCQFRLRRARRLAGRGAAPAAPPPGRPAAVARCASVSASTGCTSEWLPPCTPLPGYGTLPCFSPHNPGSGLDRSLLQPFIRHHVLITTRLRLRRLWCCSCLVIMCDATYSALVKGSSSTCLVRSGGVRDRGGRR